MIQEELARKLLEIRAFVFRPEQFFTWTSGIQSPVYCDNRLILSYPDIRNLVVEGFLEKMQQHYPEVDTVAGVATAGIPYAAMVAQKKNLPMVYVRTSAKGHGKENKIEGYLPAHHRVLIFEDLISLGGSSLNVAQTLRENGNTVLGVLAIFSYELPPAVESFRKAQVPYFILTQFETLIQEAIQLGTLREQDRQIIEDWRKTIRLI
ncbi:MAG: orotate phosphoribosyltransferase [Planctomycetota bacterium]